MVNRFPLSVMTAFGTRATDGLKVSIQPKADAQKRNSLFNPLLVNSRWYDSLMNN